MQTDISCNAYPFHCIANFIQDLLRGEGGVGVTFSIKGLNEELLEEQPTVKKVARPITGFGECKENDLVRKQARRRYFKCSSRQAYNTCMQAANTKVFAFVKNRNIFQRKCT